MSAPHLVSCYFANGSDTRFERMARVLRYTAAKYCPDWTIAIDAITPAPMRSALGVPSHVSNTQKMEAWWRAVEALPDESRVLLIDADTFIVGPLDAVWDLDFDFAYTSKEHTRFPFNSGVVFLRVTPAVRAFMRVWRDENVRMLGDAANHRPWREAYGGINQASLGYALRQAGIDPKHPPADAFPFTSSAGTMQIRRIPCQVWNCEDSHWHTFDPQATRIVHLKGILRTCLFQPTSRRSRLRTLITLWHALERDAGRDGRAA